MSYIFALYMPMNSYKQAEVGSTVKQGQRPLRRRFVSYSFGVGESGNLELVDSYEEFDVALGQYNRKEVRTELPPQLAQRVTEESRTQLAQYCSVLRHELDQGGLKLFFDPVGRGSLRPKWRYRLTGRTHTDYVTVEDDIDIRADSYDHNPDSVPSWIMQLVQHDYRYHLTPEWRSWFGRKMQRKREEIIIGKLMEIA